MRLICSAESLENGGSGVRFPITRFGQEEQAFVIRFNGTVHGYLNQCGHVPTELDWTPGEFFESDRRYLICSVHGALYSPETGRCLGGRCNGKGLVPLLVVEHDGQVYLVES